MNSKLCKGLGVERLGVLRRFFLLYFCVDCNFMSVGQAGQYCRGGGRDMVHRWWCGGGRCLRGQVFCSIVPKFCHLFCNPAVDVVKYRLLLTMK